MQKAEFTKELNLPKGGGLYIKLAKQGDKIKFRIADTPLYETKHFLGGKDVVECQKFNSDDSTLTCKYCDDYEKAKSMGDEETAKQIKPATSFYYPILDLSDNKAKIFQFSAKSIHYTIKGYSDEGVDVFGCDWSVTRTEEQGSYYKVLRLDSKPLTKEQKEEMGKAKTLLIKGNKKESDSLSKGTDEVSDEDIEKVSAEVGEKDFSA